MTTQSESTVWHVKLTPYQYSFFKELAEEKGDTERGCEARQCRKFLDEKIIAYKRANSQRVS
jgi:hypothetical protein